MGVGGNSFIIALLVIGDAPPFPARFVSTRGLGVQLWHGTNHLYEQRLFFHSFNFPVQVSEVDASPGFLTV